MKCKDNSPKSHHFVPESYLKRFADPSGFLHIYDRTANQWRKAKPKEVMHIRYYYRQEWAPPGVDQNIAEIVLGEWLDNLAKNAIDDLMFTPWELAEEKFATLLQYLEFQRIRVPRQAEAAMMLMRQTILRLAPPDIAVEVDAGKFQLSMNKSARFDYMRMMVGQFLPWFGRMEWEIIEAEKGSAFIATDSPLSFYNAACLPPAEAGIAFAGTIVLFPLSPRYLLTMRHPEYRKNRDICRLEVIPDPILRDRTVPISRGRVWNKETVANHNKVMGLLSDRLVVGESKEVLEQCLTS